MPRTDRSFPDRRIFFKELNVRWILESTDDAAALAKALNLTAPAARVLAARGFGDPEAPAAFSILRWPIFTIPIC